MGALPKTYTLNLSINSNIDHIWLKRFTNHLSKIQKKYNMYLLGGDISRSKEISNCNLFWRVKIKKYH